MSAPRVLFYVQHLLGIGHQRRGATLARAMQRAGLAVTYVSGGHEIPNLDLAGGELAQLPPVRATDLYFKHLVDEHDRPIDDAWRARRAAALLALFERVRPDVVLLELFPFGRRQMRFELLPLLDAAQARPTRPAILSSVRDILVAQNKPGRNDEMLALAERYFDHVLVHGDPRFISLDRTFPHTSRIADRLHYTGYVVDETGRPGKAGDDGWQEVVVSAGGGAVGDHLLRTAMQARARSCLADRRWRVLVGVKVPEEEFSALRREAPPGVIVERARGDFPTLLMNCALSISQAGYNTMMESLRAGCRSVVVPYAGGLETEQTLRARLLAERTPLQMVAEEALDAERLAAAVDRAMAAPPLGDSGIDISGAQTGAAAVHDWALRAREGRL